MRPHKRWCASRRGHRRSRRGETVGGEEGDVHPQPAARFPFALHLGDEALAFFRGDGDILHVRPFLCGWMDWRLYHATKDGRLFNYLALSSSNPQVGDVDPSVTIDRGNRSATVIISTSPTAASSISISPVSYRFLPAFVQPASSAQYPEETSPPESTPSAPENTPPPENTSPPENTPPPEHTSPPESTFLLRALLLRALLLLLRTLLMRALLPAMTALM